MSRLQSAGHRPTILAGIVGGERQQAGVIKSNDGKQATSSPDWMSRPDPLQTSALPKSAPVSGLSRLEDAAFIVRGECARGEVQWLSMPAQNDKSPNASDAFKEPPYGVVHDLRMRHWTHMAQMFELQHLDPRQHGRE